MLTIRLSSRRQLCRFIHVNIELEIQRDEDQVLVEKTYELMGFKVRSIDGKITEIDGGDGILALTLSKTRTNGAFADAFRRSNSSTHNILGITVRTQREHQALRCENSQKGSLPYFGVDMSTESSLKSESNLHNIHNNSVDTRTKSAATGTDIKEVVIPCGETNHEQLTAVRSLLTNELGLRNVAKCPDVYAASLGVGSSNQNGNELYLRALPTDYCCVVLCVACLSKFMETHFNNSVGLTWSWIGRNGYGAACGEPQIQLHSPHLCGLDVRVTESRTVNSFFNEGSASLLKGAVPALQSPRVLGGPASAAACSNISNGSSGGDCWMEARVMMGESLRNAVLNGISKLLSYASTLLAPNSVQRSGTRVFYKGPNKNH